jgi:hypothetical protein
MTRSADEFGSPYCMLRKVKIKNLFESFTCNGCMKSIPTKIETTNEISQHLVLSSPNSSPKFF